MNLLAWNLNHRAARRAIPTWVSQAIAREAPAIVVLTEYVVGPDHQRFLTELAAAGLGHVALTPRVGRSNQVLIAAREPVADGTIIPPELDPSVPPNFLHVVLPVSGLQVIGFRMPAFTRAFRGFKRKTFEWLIEALESVKGEAAVIAGDFNTDPDDGQEACGDCLREIAGRGWRLIVPAEGRSWPADPARAGRRIDLAFVSPGFGPVQARYSWEFRQMNEEAGQGWVGRPDHAMLVLSLTASWGAPPAGHCR